MISSLQIAAGYAVIFALMGACLQIAAGYAVIFALMGACFEILFLASLIIINLTNMK